MISIFKKEISVFFSTPIGHLIIGVFLLLNGVLLWSDFSKINILDSGYADMDIFFEIAPLLFLLFIPAVSMRVFTEEYANGTMETLVTKPITSLQIVLGKFLSVFSLVLFAIIPTLIYVISIYYIGENIGNLDLAGILGSYFGLIFLCSLFSSVSVYASSIANNQIISYVLAILLNTLFYFGFDVLSELFFFQNIDLIIQQIGISSHYEMMSKGLIKLSDIIYFLSFTFLFIRLTGLVVIEEKGLMKASKHLSALLLITLVFLINILCSFINWDVDLTTDKKHSLSAETYTIINTLDDRLFIKVYLEGDFPAKLKKLQKATENLLRNLKEISDNNIDFEFINPNESNNDEKKLTLFRQLVKLKLAPTDLDMSKMGKQVNQIIFPGAIIYYKDKQVAVNFLKQKSGETPAGNINISIENLEFEFISAIQHLTKEKLDKIAFLDGNGELDEQQVYDITESASEDNFNLSYHYNVNRFNIKEFIIDSTTMQPNLSRQLAMLNMYKLIIIAKPTIPFNNLDKFLIDQYVMNGGKILWLVDGVQANMDSLQNKSGTFIAAKNDLNIDDQLQKYGVRINANLIEDLRSAKILIPTGYSNNKPQTSLFAWPYFPLLISDNQHTITKGLDGIKCSFVSSLDTIKNNISKTILLHSSKQSRLNPAPIKISRRILENPPATESYNKEYEPIAILLEGEFESIFKNRLVQKNNQIELKNKSIPTKMIVVADGDLISNDVSISGIIFPLGYDKNIKYTYPGNKHFLINAIQYLCNDSSLSRLKTKELNLRMLNKEKIQKKKFFIQLMNIIFPIVLLLLFAFYFIQNKKNKYA